MMEAMRRTDIPIAKPMPMLCGDVERSRMRYVSGVMGEAAAGRTVTRRTRSDISSDGRRWLSCGRGC